MQLTASEYSTWYSNALKKFAASQNASWDKQVYRVNNKYQDSKGIKLFLYTYALSTWEHSDTAFNYLTEDQVLGIISKVNQL